jgi:hypothetical protein
MDIKVAFATQEPIPDVARAVQVLGDLLTRLRIGHCALPLESKPVQLPHGFFPIRSGMLEHLTKAQRLHYTVRHLRGKTYILEHGPLEQTPHYQWRVQLLEAGIETVDVMLEAQGFQIALHQHAMTFDWRIIALHEADQSIGPFTGQIFGEEQPFPSSIIVERTGLWGPLVHMQFVECLAALKREAIPSLTIHDPSGYADHGDVFALLEAMSIADVTYNEFSKAIGLPPLEPQTAPLFVPALEGAVGSADRVRQLEEFLFTQGIAPVDIDALMVRKR